MDPVPTSAKTPTQAITRSDSEQAILSRKHGALLEEWAAVQREADLLREELREDKWLTVFRTVTDQADGMMNSLDKAINRCQVSSNPYYSLALVSFLVGLPSSNELRRNDSSFTMAS